MVFAQSKQKNISKIYTPKMIEILEKYNSDNDSLVLKIILYTFLIIFAIALITLIIVSIIKKKMQKKRTHNEINLEIIEPNIFNNFENGQNDRLINDTNSLNLSDVIDLPSESQVYKKVQTGIDYEAPSP